MGPHIGLQNEVSPPLLVSLDCGVLQLTLNRPEARNALSIEMLDMLAAALVRAESDPAVRVVVLTGAGRAFCAGGDIKTLARGESIFGPMNDPQARTARQVASQRATSVRLRESIKPTIALLNGHAVGAGMALALACDLRYAAASAELRPGFSRIGLAGDFGATWLLTDLVGRARAQELLYFAEPIPAARAQHLGLISDCFPDEELRARGMERARVLASRSQPAVTAIKSNLEHAANDSMADAADAEAAWHVRLLETPEHGAALAQALGVRPNRPSPSGTADLTTTTGSTSQ